MKKRLSQHLSVIYDTDVGVTVEKIMQLLNRHIDTEGDNNNEKWSEADVLLITYGDSVAEESIAPLRTLKQFSDKYLSDVISCVHILPFFPFSSDDGFSVIDYLTVDPALGDWQDIQALSVNYKLMFDLVINHVSSQSLWFYDFVGDIKPACDYFIEMDPQTDVSLVTRPRNSPLLVAVNTHRGTRHLWATFSEDQIDVNFKNPDVLVKYIEILLTYITDGANWIRLDAIAFLWKELGTPCVHLKQTHEVVKLIRSIFDIYLPQCVLLTETNVPHKENISYFGNNDEAHMVYQFSLPPLILHALNRGTSNHLYEWASQLQPLSDNATYLNFTASHDGVGLRALEGVLSTNELNDLLDCMHRFGGFVSMKSNSDGVDTPYEINISYFDAMQGTRRGPDQFQVQRFVCSQAIMLSLQGIPAFYINSIIATENDLHGVESTGRTRSINRKKWNYQELESLLENKNSVQADVFELLSTLIRLRKQYDCFHPSATQQIIDTGDSVFSLIRCYEKTNTVLFALHNVTAVQQTHKISAVEISMAAGKWLDIITGESIKLNADVKIVLNPYQVAWFVPITQYNAH